MKVSITKRHDLDNYLVWRTICLDSDDCTRAADIVINHYPEDAERNYAVTLYKIGGKTVRNIKIDSWQKAKNLALLWVEG